MTNQTPESVIAEVIEYHADTIGSHYDGCYKHHAACLAVRLRNMLREPGAPDAREHLHAKCDCVPDLGPAHCHLCSGEGAPVKWEDCEAVTSTTPDAATAESERRAWAIAGHLERDREAVKAERDAALAAIERVRGILDRDDFGDSWEHDDWVYRDAAEKKLSEIEAALDGAPERLSNHCQECGAWGSVETHLRGCSLDGAPEPEVKP